MTFTFDLDRDPAHDAERLLDRCITKARRRVAMDDRVIATHETRKALKKVRALLRLIRPGLAKSDWRDRTVRDMGRVLSAARDRDVISQTLLSIEPRLSDSDPTRRAAQALRGRLSAIGNLAGRGKPAQNQRGIEAVTQTLDGLVPPAGQPLISAEPLSAIDWDVITAGFEDGYRRCRKEFKHALESGDDEAYHDWRKALQIHARHARMLHPLWPDILVPRAELARDVAQAVGRDHDLAVLVTYLKGPAREIVAKPHRKRILALARDEQQALRAAVTPVARRLFAQRPRALGELIEGCRRGGPIRAPLTQQATATTGTGKADRANASRERSRTSGQNKGAGSGPPRRRATRPAPKP